MFVLAKHGLASYFEPPELWRELSQEPPEFFFLAALRQAKHFK
jgi:hypothetical protein